MKELSPYPESDYIVEKYLLMTTDERQDAMCGGERVTTRYFSDISWITVQPDEPVPEGCAPFIGIVSPCWSGLKKK